MRKINIFVAGSQKLMDERTSIKSLANDLNQKFLNKKKDICIIIHSCEHFDDRQGEYNKFIENDADIVLFVLDGSIGEKTEEEFLKATETKAKSNRPEVMVFVKKQSDTNTEGMGRIKGLIAARLGDQYYIPYDDINDLRTQAKERILRYIDNLDKDDDTPESTPTKDNVAGRKEKSDKWLIPSLLGIIIILGGLLCYHTLKKDEILIFAGGGSVKNYIQDQRKVDLQDYPQSVYSNLASGSAWSLLLEEANRYEEDEGKSLERFASICLSAGDIDSASFFNERALDLFPKERIRLMKYHLGNDSLAIYVHTDLLKSRGISTDATTISVDSLRSLIKFVLDNPRDIRVFCTSKTSGTLKMYQECFTPSDSIDFQNLLDQQKINLYYQNSSAAHIHNLGTLLDVKPCIILGSEHYYPRTIWECNPSEIVYNRLFVKDGETVIQKPMNLYFLARENDSERDTYVIRKSIVSFLEAIDAGCNIDQGTWNDIKKGKFKAKTGSFIQDIN